MQTTSIKGRKNTHLPNGHWTAHELCFFVHDVMAQVIESGEAARAFDSTFEFRDEKDQEAFEAADTVFSWLELTHRDDEREAFLVTVVLPAVLSDMLHCFYEALETSRKGKLNITYMLIRKPLQESLFLLETVIADQTDFTAKLSTNPIKLHSQLAGGLEVHTKRIAKVLDAIKQNHRFDAAYLAQLRYDKSAQDGFDGICNKAMHLFTSHKAIATEPFNINFVFSGKESKLTQWSYLYSRLPYLLVYMHCVVEHICANIAPTEPSYLHNIERRISAMVLLWWRTLEPSYKNQSLESFVEATNDWLNEHCRALGHQLPSDADLKRMAETGANPRASKMQRFLGKALGAWRRRNVDVF